MLPENQLSTTPVAGKFLIPTGLARTTLEYYELGGIAIQDPSQGLQYQTWYGWYDPETFDVIVKGLLSGVQTTLFNEPELVEFSFCFDQNMRWAAVVKLLDGTVKFRWYDTTTESYTTTTYPTTYLSPKLTLDDKRAIEFTRNDIILTYIHESDLYVRVQRDRFLIPYLLHEDVPPGFVISHFGMTSQLRLQWKFAMKG